MVHCIQRKGYKGKEEGNMWSIMVLYHSNKIPNTRGFCSMDAYFFFRDGDNF